MMHSHDDARRYVFMRDVQLLEVLRRLRPKNVARHQEMMRTIFFWFENLGRDHARRSHDHAWWACAVLDAMHCSRLKVLPHWPGHVVATGCWFEGGCIVLSLQPQSCPRRTISFLQRLGRALAPSPQDPRDQGRTPDPHRLLLVGAGLGVSCHRHSCVLVVPLLRLQEKGFAPLPSLLREISTLVLQ